MTLREAAQQALEALESCQDGDYTTGDVLRQSFDEQAVNAAIVALWAALAEPVQEPYAWMAVGGSIWRHKTSEDDVPLYTSPPQRKPLSGLEVERLLEQVIGSLPAARRLVRAIERAHGIK